MVFAKGLRRLVFKGSMNNYYKCTVYIVVLNEIRHTTTQLQSSIAIAALE